MATSKSNIRVVTPSEPTWIERVISTILDRFGSGWKTVIGLAMMAVSLTLGLLELIPDQQVDTWFRIGATVAGVGLLHKTVRG